MANQPGQGNPNQSGNQPTSPGQQQQTDPSKQQQPGQGNPSQSQKR
jgi:hypothetical protein